MNIQHSALGALLCLGVAAGVHAQTKADASDVRVTLIGCIQRSQPMPADAATTTVIPEGETRYVLSKITLVPEEAPTGTAGDQSAGDVLAQAVNVYRLDDSADSVIAPHVGDRVRVIGTVVTAPSTATSTNDRIASPATGITRAPMLRVNSLQKISSDSSTCSP
jgi:hypothetical protein